MCSMVVALMVLLPYKERTWTLWNVCLSIAEKKGMLSHCRLQHSLHKGSSEEIVS